MQRPNLSVWRSFIRLVCAPEVSRRPVSPLRVAEHPDEHRPERPVLLAVDQEKRLVLLTGLHPRRGRADYLAADANHPTVRSGLRRSPEVLGG
jgi:hypothetical protein